MPFERYHEESFFQSIAQNIPELIIEVKRSLGVILMRLKERDLINKELLMELMLANINLHNQEIKEYKEKIDVYDSSIQLKNIIENATEHASLNILTALQNEIAQDLSYEDKNNAQEDAFNYSLHYVRNSNISQKDKHQIIFYICNFFNKVDSKEYEYEMMVEKITSVISDKTYQRKNVYVETANNLIKAITYCVNNIGDYGDNAYHAYKLEYPISINVWESIFNEDVANVNLNVIDELIQMKKDESIDNNIMYVIDFLIVRYKKWLSMDEELKKNLLCNNMKRQIRQLKVIYEKFQEYKKGVSNLPVFDIHCYKQKIKTHILKEQTYIATIKDIIKLSMDNDSNFLTDCDFLSNLNQKERNLFWIIGSGEIAGEYTALTTRSKSNELFELFDLLNENLLLEGKLSFTDFPLAKSYYNKFIQTQIFQNDLSKIDILNFHRMNQKIEVWKNLPESKKNKAFDDMTAHFKNLEKLENDPTLFIHEYSADFEQKIANIRQVEIELKECEDSIHSMSHKDFIIKTFNHFLVSKEGLSPLRKKCLHTLYYFLQRKNIMCEVDESIDEHQVKVFLNEFKTFFIDNKEHIFATHLSEGSECLRYIYDISVDISDITFKSMSGHLENRIFHFFNKTDKGERLDAIFKLFDSKVLSNILIFKKLFEVTNNQYDIFISKFTNWFDSIKTTINDRELLLISSLKIQSDIFSVEAMSHIHKETILRGINISQIVFECNEEAQVRIFNNFHLNYINDDNNGINYILELLNMVSLDTVVKNQLKSNTNILISLSKLKKDNVVDNFLITQWIEYLQSKENLLDPLSWMNIYPIKDKFALRLINNNALLKEKIDDKQAEIFTHSLENNVRNHVWLQDKTLLAWIDDKIKTNNLNDIQKLYEIASFSKDEFIFLNHYFFQKCKDDLDKQARLFIQKDFTVEEIELKLSWNIILSENNDELLNDKEYLENILSFIQKIKELGGLEDFIKKFPLMFACILIKSKISIEDFVGEKINLNYIYEYIVTQTIFQKKGEEYLISTKAIKNVWPLIPKKYQVLTEDLLKTKNDSDTYQYIRKVAEISSCLSKKQPLPLEKVFDLFHYAQKNKLLESSDSKLKIVLIKDKELDVLLGDKAYPWVNLEIDFNHFYYGSYTEEERKRINQKVLELEPLFSKKMKIAKNFFTFQNLLIAPKILIEQDLSNLDLLYLMACSKPEFMHLRSTGFGKLYDATNLFIEKDRYKNIYLSNFLSFSHLEIGLYIAKNKLYLHDEEGITEMKNILDNTPLMKDSYIYSKRDNRHNILIGEIDFDNDKYDVRNDKRQIELNIKLKEQEKLMGKPINKVKKVKV